MEVFPRVHLVSARYANAYLCVGENGLILIDTGPPGREEAILAYIEKIGRRAEEVHHIFITHADWDHAGSAAALQTATGATVTGGEKTTSWLQKGKSPRHLPQPFHFLIQRLARYDPLPSATLQSVADGEELDMLDGFLALATPGHTPDHFAFYSPAIGVLFAGDALSTRGNQLRLPPQLITADREAALRSARRLLSLTPALFACGHGPPLREHTLRDLMVALQGLR